MPRIDRCVKIALDALFPMRCIVCNSMDETGLCPSCSAAAPRIDNPCRQCGAAIAVFPGDIRCGRCQTRPPAFELTIAPFTYAPPLSGIVYQFKYRRRIALARPLAKILAREIKSRGIELPELMVPVPLHWTRLVRRGFNQSWEICRALSAELSIYAERSAIKRTRRTPPQTELPLRRRRLNVRGCFKIEPSLRVDSIAIVDDVITSGETINQVASLFKKHGVQNIQSWAILRTSF
jgi:ComF family protein